MPPPLSARYLNRSSSFSGTCVGVGGWKERSGTSQAQDKAPDVRSCAPPSLRVQNRALAEVSTEWRQRVRLTGRFAHDAMHDAAMSYDVKKRASLGWQWTPQRTNAHLHRAALARAGVASTSALLADRETPRSVRKARIVALDSLSSAALESWCHPRCNARTARATARVILW